MRGRAPGAVWDSATDLKSGRLFDFSVGLKTRALPTTAQFFLNVVFLCAAASQGHFFAVDIKSENTVSWSTCSLSLNDSGKAPRSLKITGDRRAARHWQRNERRTRGSVTLELLFINWLPNFQCQALSVDINHPSIHLSIFSTHFFLNSGLRRSVGAYPSCQGEGRVTPWTYICLL